MQIFLTRFFYLCLLSLLSMFAVLPPHSFAQPVPIIAKLGVVGDTALTATGSITYTPNPVVFSAGQQINDMVPLVTTSTPTSWSVFPALPAGLILDSHTGIISGTPQFASSATNYKISASLPNNPLTVILNITVNPQPPTIRYPQSEYIFTAGTPIATLIPVISGNARTVWSMSPSIAGLSINPNTGAISGTPTEVKARTSYTVLATFSSSKATAVLNITVLIPKPKPNYAPNTYILPLSQSITPIIPTNSGGAANGWSISPVLPTGLSIDSNGVISGRPTQLSPTRSYTVTASNSSGNGSTPITISVVDAVPAPRYTPNSFIFTRGTPIASITPSNNGGFAKAWAINTPLPAGLQFNPVDGTISGTPSELKANTAYTVTASNDVGTANTGINIQVIDIKPVPSYVPNPAVFTKGNAISMLPSNSGGPAISWNISGNAALPWLQFDSATGKISGTPNALASATNLTITATNSGGSNSTVLVIQVKDALPIPAYSPNPMQLAQGATINVTPSNTGGAATAWSINRALPQGLNFSTTTGVISGTATQASAMSDYVITASNASGDGNVTLKLGVNPPAPNISCPNAVITQGQYASLSCTNSGGPITSWSMPNTAPDGMSFSNGVLSGTPTTTGYFVLSVSAVNGSIVSSALMIVTINPAPPQITCPNATLPLGLPASLTCTNSGGPISSWQIHSGSLQAGLTFANGLVSGSPSAAYNSTLTIKASNAGGDSYATMQINVVNRAPELTCPSALQFDGNNQIVSPFIANNGASPIDSWQVSPALPPGLSVSRSGNGLQITGSLASLSNDRQFTLQANNAGGSGYCQFTITGPIPQLNCPATLNVDRNDTINPVFTVSSDVPVQFRSGDLFLPQGISESRTPTSTSLSGTVIGPWSMGYYSYIAWNTFGESMCRFYVYFEKYPPQNVSPLLNSFGSKQTVTEDKLDALSCGKDGVLKRRTIEESIQIDGQYDSFTLQGPAKQDEILRKEVHETLCDGTVRQTVDDKGIHGTWILKLQRGAQTSVHTFSK